MFRFSLIVCVALIFGITAKPFKPEIKLPDEAFQDAVMSLDENGKMSWQVEPPEDMDETDYDIDPRMRVWNTKAGEAADEDLDELQHPSIADLLKAQIQKLGALSAADIQAEPWHKVPNMKHYQEPEEDKDDIEHPVQDWDEVYHKGRKVQVMHPEPEKDEDELYHHDNQLLPVQVEPLGHEVRGQSGVRVHLEPEEDMDDLYHKVVLQPIPYQGDSEAAAPVDVPNQRKYSMPEEDLDDLYH